MTAQPIADEEFDAFCAERTTRLAHRPVSGFVLNLTYVWDPMAD